MRSMLELLLGVLLETTHFLNVQTIIIHVCTLNTSLLIKLQIAEQLMIHKLHQSHIELQEGGHHLKVNIERQSLVELVG